MSWSVGQLIIKLSSVESVTQINELFFCLVLVPYIIFENKIKKFGNLFGLPFDSLVKATEKEIQNVTVFKKYSKECTSSFSS